MLALREALWRASAPVSASRNSLGELRGIHRAAVDSEAPSGASWADELLDEARWHERVRAELAALAGEDGLGLASILSDEPARTFAESSGAPVQKVYRSASRIRRRAFGSLELYRLWRER